MDRVKRNHHSITIRLGLISLLKQKNASYDSRKIRFLFQIFKSHYINSKMTSVFVRIFNLFVLHDDYSIGSIIPIYLVYFPHGLHA